MDGKVLFFKATKSFRGSKILKEERRITGFHTNYLLNINFGFLIA